MTMEELKKLIDSGEKIDVKFKKSEIFNILLSIYCISQLKCKAFSHYLLS